MIEELLERGMGGKIVNEILQGIKFVDRCGVTVMVYEPEPFKKSSKYHENKPY